MKTHYYTWIWNSTFPLQIVSANMIGSLICTREAIRVMKLQRKGGHIFNMDGAGSGGSSTPLTAVYEKMNCDNIHLHSKWIVITSVCTQNLVYLIISIHFTLKTILSKNRKLTCIVLLKQRQIICRYGATKCGLRQLHGSLLKECKGSRVGIHTASPGMVLTDLLLR